MLPWAAAVAIAVGVTAASCGTGGDSAEATRTPSTTTAAAAEHFSLVDLDVVGLTRRAAETRLRGVGWSIEYSSSREVGYEPYTVFLPDDPDWIICSQRFSTLVDGTRSLDLDAAPTCGEIELPRLAGRTFGEAQELARRLGLLLWPDTSSGQENLGDDWIVCDQDPPPGPIVRSEIELFTAYVEPSGGC